MSRLTESIQYKESRRSQAEVSKNYKLCEDLTDEIRDNERERGTLRFELNKYKLSEKRSQSYHRNKKRHEQSAGGSTSESDMSPPLSRRPRLSYSDSGSSTDVLVSSEADRSRSPSAQFSPESYVSSPMLSPTCTIPPGDNQPSVKSPDGEQTPIVSPAVDQPPIVSPTVDQPSVISPDGDQPPFTSPDGDLPTGTSHLDVSDQSTVVTDPSAGTLNFR